MSRLPTEFECFGGAGNPKPGEPKGKLNSLTKTFNQSINQSIILFSDKSRLQKCSHDADVDLQLTSKMWNNKQNNF